MDRLDDSWAELIVVIAYTNTLLLIVDQSREPELMIEIAGLIRGDS